MMSASGGSSDASQLIAASAHYTDEDSLLLQVLDCSGEGAVSQVVAGLDWVAEKAQQPAIVTMSLGTQDPTGSQALDGAVKALTTRFNITVIVAAGNDNANSCSFAPGKPSARFGALLDPKMCPWKACSP